MLFVLFDPAQINSNKILISDTKEGPKPAVLTGVLGVLQRVWVLLQPHHKVLKDQFARKVSSQKGCAVLYATVHDHTKLTTTQQHAAICNNTQHTHRSYTHAATRNTSRKHESVIKKLLMCP